MTYQHRLMNEVEQNAYLPLSNTEQCLLKIREYSINRVITYSQLTKGVFADLTRRQISDDQQKRLLAFLRLPFFQAEVKLPNTKMERLDFMNKPLDSVKVMLFFILYTGGISIESLKKKRAALLKLVFGEERLVIDRDSQHLYNLIFDLFYIPTLISAQAVITDFGFQNSIFKKEEHVQAKNIGILIEQYYREEDISNFLVMYKFKIREEILKEFVLFILKQHFSEIRSFIQMKTFSKKMEEFEYFMVNPRKIRYEFLQYSENFKNPILNKIERSMNERIRSNSQTKKKKSKKFQQRNPSLPEIGEVPHSPRDNISVISEPGQQKKKKKALKPNKSYVHKSFKEDESSFDFSVDLEEEKSFISADISHDSSGFVNSKSTEIQYLSFERPQFNHSSKTIVQKPSPVKKNQGKLENVLEKVPAWKRSVRSSTQERKRDSRLSQNPRSNLKSPSLRFSTEDNNDLNEDIQERSRILSEKEKDVSQVEDEFTHPSTIVEGEVAQKAKRQALIQDYLSVKFERGFVNFFFHFIKKRYKVYQDSISGKIHRMKSITEVIKYTPDKFTEDQNGLLYKFKREIKKRFSIEDLTSLTGEHTLSNNFYDFYIQVMKQMLKVDHERYKFALELGEQLVSQPLQVVYFPYNFSLLYEIDTNNCLNQFQDQIGRVLESDFAIIPIQADALVILDIQMNKAICYSFKQEIDQTFVSSILINILSQSSQLLDTEDPSQNLAGSFQQVVLKEHQTEIMLMTYIVEKITLQKALDIYSFQETDQRARILDTLVYLASIVG